MSEQKTNAVFAEEALVVDVQAFLHRVMMEKNISRAQLAQAMGVSKSRVTQIFSDECKNFTIRLLARAVHAMGEEVQITSGCSDRLDGAETAAEQRLLIAASKNVTPLWRNENEEADRRFEQNGIPQRVPGDKRLNAALNSLSKMERSLEVAVG